MSHGKQLSGLRDKLYWRPVGRGDQWCCFKKDETGGYTSFCRRNRIAKGRLGGQDCRRPVPMARCARCEDVEMNRRGWEESGPTLYPKQMRGR